MWVTVRVIALGSWTVDVGAMMGFSTNWAVVQLVSESNGKDQSFLLWNLRAQKQPWADTSPHKTCQLVYGKAHHK